LLGLDRADDFDGAERETPELVMLVWPGDPVADGRPRAGPALPLHVDLSLASEVGKQRWHGKANRLSPEHPVPWDIIAEVESATRKPSGVPRRLALADAPAARRESAVEVDGAAAGRIIRQRRSLLACDGKTSIPAERIFRMLARVMPRRELEVLRRPMPWDAIPWEPAIHLGLFVHRVEGLDPGLYMLARDPAKVDALKRATHARFAWSAPPGCPADLPLFLLEAGDARQLASQVSCNQSIAGDGAFAVGMIAEYQQTLVTHGPWSYRRLFWETGLIGQVLYLEAEAAGVRATGIGCFFDDPVHQVFGFEDLAFQSLYHFTVGGAVEDPRLTTLPPYGAHLQGREV
jgi:hypothetical protein